MKTRGKPPETPGQSGQRVDIEWFDRPRPGVNRADLGIVNPTSIGLADTVSIDSRDIAHGDAHWTGERVRCRTVLFFGHHDARDLDLGSGGCAVIDPYDQVGLGPP